MYLTQPADFDKACNKVDNISGSMDIRPSSSTLSFSAPRNFTINNYAGCHDSVPSRTSPDVDAEQLQVRANSRMKYKEKKQSRL